ncbi:MAG: CDP-diacylglycerol--serine O-phosphatidyltransferase [Candidatus Latescibacteria bacterium]|nr:CDP-diacylglycerol--serine O-phosphatidyltransferase [Candidatus Latescibacterota bacterium]
MTSRAILPNLFTIGNLFCGFLAIHYIVGGNYVSAAWLIVLGAALDNMDGKLARHLGKNSQFGIEFDSLADVCTFGMAPALMVYFSLLHSGWEIVFPFLYLTCGALRLARFNSMAPSTGKKEFFTGLPIPCAALILSQYVVFTELAWATDHAMQLGAGLILFLGALMVSRIPFDTMASLRASTPWGRFKQFYFLVTLGLIVYPSTSKEFFFPLAMLYLLPGFYRWVNALLSDEVTQHA